jgi:hypothetical protein
MKMPMIEVTQNQSAAADHMNDPAVFTPCVAQSVRLLTGLVHDTNLPDKVRQGAARLLIPHLQLERDRLLRERAMARTSNAHASVSTNAG